MPTLPLPAEGFDQTGLSPAVLSAVHRAGFTVPTPIQAQTIPLGVQGRDLIGLAQTGTGKTMAFSLPIVDRLLADRKQRALIIVPTRELALQVEESIRAITRLLNPSLRTVCLIGGVPIYRQIRELRISPSIIVGTPGRLRDHLDQKTLDLSAVTVLVLDEADRMLDMGFAPQIKYVIDNITSKRQTLLFSATMPPEIASMAHAYLQDPLRVEVKPVGLTSSQIAQELCYTTQDGKRDLLQKILTTSKGTVLVFARTKHGTTKLAKQIQDAGHSSAEMHSNRSLSQRRAALDGFKSGRYRVLVATDVAARGIDVSDIGLVINYDLPDASEDYVHRIGRTGRAGKDGKAISFATFDQVRDVKAIERHMNRSIPLSEYSLPAPAVDANRFGARRSNQNPNRNRTFFTNKPTSSQRRYGSSSTGRFMPARKEAAR